MELAIAKLTILVFILNYAYNVIGTWLGFKFDKSMLACGLFGFIGDTPPNLDKIKIVGMYNMARGDDSCGVSINHHVYKGIDDKANWFDFIEKITLPQFTTNICIGHTRKATTGAKITSNAHPFAYFPIDESKKKKVPYAIAAHNGVIRNCEALQKRWKKYKGNYPVDSMLLLNMIIDSREDVDNVKAILEAYEGFAACMWYFPDQNTLYVFRGKSGSGEDTTGERPLYYWKAKGKNTVYISSLKESLEAICDDVDKDIIAFDTNVIYAITDGKISRLKIEIDRSGKNGTSSTALDVDADDAFINFPNKVMKKFAKKNVKQDQHNFYLEDEPYFNPFHPNKVVFSQGKYHLGGGVLGNELATGEIVKLDEDGVREGAKECLGKVKSYYFWNGWICLDEEHMHILCKSYLNKNSGLWTVSETEKKLGNVYSLDFLAKHCEGMVFNNRKSGGYYKFCEKGESSCVYLTGKFAPRFNQEKIYEFSSGFFKKVEFSGIEEAEVEEMVALPPSGSKIGESDNEEQTHYNQESKNMLSEIKNFIDEADVNNDGLIKDYKVTNLKEPIVKIGDVFKHLLEYINPHYEALVGSEEILN